jgi:hypothetical protein
MTRTFLSVAATAGSLTAQTIHVYALECESVRTAAATYFPTRGIVVSPLKKKGFNCYGDDYCFHLRVPQLLDPHGNAMNWGLVRDTYFSPPQFTYDEKRIWSRGGNWETASKWTMAGSYELRKKDEGCLLRIGFGYGRSITQFAIFFPIDEYGQDLQSNNRLERESIDGIEKILSAR